MKDLTIKEIRELRLKCSEDILFLCNKFEVDTGEKIDSIELYTMPERFVGIFLKPI